MIVSNRGGSVRTNVVTAQPHSRVRFRLAPGPPVGRSIDTITPGRDGARLRRLRGRTCDQVVNVLLPEQKWT